MREKLAKERENKELIKELEKDLPVTESQNVRELDLITKPKDMQRKMHQEKLDKAEEEAKSEGKMNTRGRSAK